jgi:Rod binding domain-containing protein
VPDLAIDPSARITAADPRQRLRQAANAFEEQFLNELMKPLAEHPLAGDDELLGEDEGGKMYQGLLRDALGQRAAGSLGIADILERQLADRLRAGGGQRAAGR